MFFTLNDNLKLYSGVYEISGESKYLGLDFSLKFGEILSTNYHVKVLGYRFTKHEILSRIKSIFKNSSYFEEFYKTNEEECNEIDIWSYGDNDDRCLFCNNKVLIIDSWRFCTIDERTILEKQRRFDNVVFIINDTNQYLGLVDGILSIYKQHDNIYRVYMTNSKFCEEYTSKFNKEFEYNDIGGTIKWKI